jgi:hypothetical protein
MTVLADIAPRFTFDGGLPDEETLVGDTSELHEERVQELAASVGAPALADVIVDQTSSSHGGSGKPYPSDEWRERHLFRDPKTGKHIIRQCTFM